MKREKQSDLEYIVCVCTSMIWGWDGGLGTKSTPRKHHTTHNHDEHEANQNEIVTIDNFS